MFKSDIIKTYILEPNYYEYETKNYYDEYEYLKIFNNNYISYINILIDYNTCCKRKQIKPNYIIIFYFNYYTNDIIVSKIKNYDNTKIDINTYYDFNIYNFDLLIKNNKIIKKIDKNIFIIKYINNKAKAIRKHKFYNSKYYYSKKYITYYLNYYIIIYNDIKKNYIENYWLRCNTIFCNFSRNFMLFI